MPVKILCPNPDCGASYSVLDEDLGRLGRCKHCGTKFPLVPGTRAEAPSSSVEPESVSRPADSGLPETFGRYRILRALGRGGMGAVYLAHDTQLDRQVALKVPHIHAFGDRPEVRQRFLREARAAARFHHPNFCPIHDIGEIDGVPYLSMAFIEGRTLADSIERGKGWPPRRAAKVARGLAVALAEAHRRGIVHRDLKPANVMVDERGGLVLMDFGLARWYDEVDATFTPTGAILGTPAYMPPEQAEGNLKAIGPRSDLYSLGVILYELLTGRRPFEGSLTKVLGMIALVEPAPPSEHRPGLDPGLEAVCLKAMAKKIEDRPASMDEFAAALQAWLDGTPSIGPAPPEAIPEEGPSVRDASRRTGLTQPPPSSRRVGLALPDPKTRQGKPYPTGDRRASRLAFALTLAAIVCGAVSWAIHASLRGSGDDTVALTTEEPITKPVAPAPQPATPRTEAAVAIAPPAASPPKSEEITTKPGAPEPVAAMPPLKTRAEAVPPAPPTGDFIPDPPPPLKTRAEVVPPAIKPRSTETITNSLGMTLRLIPAGEFLMGSDNSVRDGRDEEKPRHRVRITRPFYLGTTEVTVGQFRRFVEATGYQTRKWRSPGFKQTDDHPVVLVSWNDAVAFCDWLGRQEGQTYRLPTEAEWEYACRAGSSTKYWFGDDAEGMPTVGNTKSEDGFPFTAPVGHYRANPFGLFDMYGNVYEWCSDWFDVDYYGTSPPADPPGPSQATLRVLRGGGHFSFPRLCGSAARDGSAPGYGAIDRGFRVARVRPE